MTALQTAVAFLFRRAAEAEMAEEALVRQASLDLHWFSPKDARRFIEVARSRGYLEAGTRPGALRPAFSLSEVEVPVDFRADVRMLDALPALSAVADDLVRKVAGVRGQSIEEVWREVERRQRETLVEAPAAAALVAAEAGVDLKPYFARITGELQALAAAARASPSSS